MRTPFFFLIAIISASCTITGTLHDDGDAPYVSPQMTIHHSSSSVTLLISGSGTVIIDWGDDTPPEPPHPVSSNTSSFQRAYSNANPRIITITGENITRLNCNNNQITHIDAGDITTLTQLFCSGNQLDELDLTKNAALTDLYCNGNNLTHLNLSDNKALKYLDCSHNQLEGLLDLSANTFLVTLICNQNRITGLIVGSEALTSLNCDANQMDAAALDDFLSSLHGNDVEGNKTVSIKYNPGADTCNKSIAEENGWDVRND